MNNVEKRLPSQDAQIQVQQPSTELSQTTPHVASAPSEGTANRIYRPAGQQEVPPVMEEDPRHHNQPGTYYHTSLKRQYGRYPYNKYDTTYNDIDEEDQFKYKHKREITNFRKSYFHHTLKDKAKKMTAKSFYSQLASFANQTELDSNH